MILYTVLQRQFSEGNFGNLQEADSVFHGVFSSEEKAKEYISTIKPEMFSSRHDTRLCTLHIIESKLDSPKRIENWMENN